MKKIISVMFILFLSVFICGCENDVEFSSTKYDSKVFDNVNDNIDKSYLSLNRIKNIYYLNPDYVEGLTEPSGKYILDNNNENLPDSYTVVIDNKEQYNSIFADETYLVDFNERILVMYSFADYYPRNIFISNIEELDGNIMISLKRKSSNRKDSVAPYQRCVLISLNKQDICNYIVDMK